MLCSPMAPEIALLKSKIPDESSVSTVSKQAINHPWLGVKTLLNCHAFNTTQRL